MKVFIAILSACVCLFGGYLVWTTEDMRDEIARLERELALTKDAEPAEVLDFAETSVVEDLADRLSRVESAASRQRSVETTDTVPGDFDALQSQIDQNIDAIAALQADIKPMNERRDAMDKTAERVLSAVGQEGEGRGLDRLRELGSIMRKKEEDLTDEEWERRQELTASFRKTQVDWGLRSFDRRLEIKLNDEQKTNLSTLLTAEQESISELRSQELSREDRKASEAEIKARTDQQIGGVLTVEQNDSWQEYRKRSSSRRFRDR